MYASIVFLVMSLVFLAISMYFYLKEDTHNMNYFMGLAIINTIGGHTNVT